MLIENVGVLTVLAMIYYFLVILIHVLILTKIISFTWVNGGRSATYETQARLSVSSMAIAAIGIVIISVTPSLVDFMMGWIGVIIFGALSIFWLLGYVMQLLGTRFERYLLSFVLLFGFYAHLEYVFFFVKG